MLRSFFSCLLLGGLISCSASSLSDEIQPSSSSFSSSSFQKREISIAPLFGNAKGAYSLILDDYCGVASGIKTHADSMARNRNLHFGFAVIVQSCSPKDWATAKDMIQYGHEAINHSWDHTCPKEDWCKNGFGPVWTEESFALQFDSTTSILERETGETPTFFAFPFDLWTKEQIEYLQAKGYLGARSGTARGQVNPIKGYNAFGLNFDGFAIHENPAWQVRGLNEFIDDAIEKSGWVIRETHGVADGSFGKMTEQEFREHLDYVAQQRDQDLLWVAPPSDVLRYLQESQSIQVELKSDQIVFSQSAKGRITLLLKTQEKNLTFQQADKDLNFVKKEGVYVLNVEPQLGVIHILNSES